MSSETSSSPSGKRSRDPEDEVYIDNLHSHKRYLSEIMASSLNGLTVGESLSENLMESPARSEGTGYTRLATVPVRKAFLCRLMASQGKGASRRGHWTEVVRIDVKKCNCNLSKDLA